MPGTVCPELPNLSIEPEKLLIVAAALYFTGYSETKPTAPLGQAKAVADLVRSLRVADLAILSAGDRVTIQDKTLGGLQQTATIVEVRSTLIVLKQTDGDTLAIDVTFDEHGAMLSQQFSITEIPREERLPQ